MTSPNVEKTITWLAAVRVISDPRLVFPAIAVAALWGTALNASWVVPVAAVWVIATAIFTLAVLLAAEPLPRFQDKSQLLVRLVWFTRFMVGAIALCISAFIGALAGASVAIDGAGIHLNSTGALFRSVIVSAAEAAILLFFAFLISDVVRFGRTGRLVAIERLFVSVLTPAAAAKLLTPFVQRWVLAFSSPIAALVSFVVVAVYCVTPLVPFGAVLFG